MSDNGGRIIRGNTMANVDELPSDDGSPNQVNDNDIKLFYCKINR